MHVASLQTYWAVLGTGQTQQEQNQQETQTETHRDTNRDTQRHKHRHTEPAAINFGSNNDNSTHRPVLAAHLPSCGGYWEPWVASPSLFATAGGGGVIRQPAMCLLISKFPPARVSIKLTSGLMLVAQVPGPRKTSRVLFGPM